MTEWTPEMVEERLFEAGAVLKRLPPVKVGGYFSTWPTMKRNQHITASTKVTPLRAVS